MTGAGSRQALAWDEKLRRALAAGRGIRLGEAAVVSRRLHVVEYHDPGRVVILSDVDFGRAAYGLAEPGLVVHIDVFHDVANVDHRAVAAAVRRALEGLPAPRGARPGAQLMDYVDLGTATGGGRITSGLDRMVNPSAMAAHRNHVHLAVLLPDEHLALAWRIVAAVEGAILAQGVELRCIERLAHRRGGVRSGDNSDLSRYYGDNLDSYIGRAAGALGRLRPAGHPDGASLTGYGAGSRARGGAPPDSRTAVSGQGAQPTADGAPPTLPGGGAEPAPAGHRAEPASSGHGAVPTRAGPGVEPSPAGLGAQPAPDGPTEQPISGPCGDGLAPRGPQAGRVPVAPEARRGATLRQAHAGAGGEEQLVARPAPERDWTASWVSGEAGWRSATQPGHPARDGHDVQRALEHAAYRTLTDEAHRVPEHEASRTLEHEAYRERAAQEAQRMLAALDLSRRIGSPDELKRVLEDLAREQGWAALYSGGGNQAPFVLRQLEEAGLVRREVRGMRLTPEGRELLAFLRSHLRDVKLRFRKLIRRIPGRGLSRLNARRPGRGAPSPDVRYGQVRGTAPAQPGAWLNDVAVPETVTAAIRRTYLERIAAGASAGTGPARLRLDRRDIHVNLRASEHPLHICLLIDASASMAGRRIMAAKHLARHLLVSTRDRIAVIAFQERDVRVYVPFTRDYGVVEEGLSRIQPLGLTPLAHGLSRSMELINSSRVRRPLLLLITDGIPTVPKWSADPLADALEAARHLRAGRIPFGCIGLQPSRRYLEQLTREAGGTLHVVEELSEESLITIAHRERLKLAPRVR
ncbi:VWA domain-containing protein [Symbiobacterium terraclitae]|uniref:VWA domain-containing protein n=1 Tax=Symbiobacterium terraclitae TaxID=557451 RepID=UPI0035B515B6